MEKHGVYSDQELIEMFHQDEVTASHEIYCRYYPKVEKFCVYFLKSQVDGQDAAQDVFLHILMNKKISQFRGESSLWAWIKRVATNKCNEVYRKKKHFDGKQLVHLDQYPSFQESLPSRAKTPEDICEHNEEKVQVFSLLTQLPETYQEVIERVGVRGCTYQETSQELGMPVKTVGVRLHRAKKLLAKLVGEQLAATETALRVELKNAWSMA